MSLEAPVVLITGAAGGLGRGLVAAFGEQGWCVAAGYHRSHRYLETEQLWPVAMDVTNSGQVGDVMEEVERRWGRLDVLVNNAGSTADGLMVQLSSSDWESMMAVHVKGAFLCSRAAMGIMSRRGDGHIINMASWSGRHGQRGQSHYAAAKAGLLGLTTALAWEAGQSGVRINAVLPGVLVTPMTAGLEASQWEALVAMNVLKRPNDILEVARFIVFLAGMRNVSGQVFQLDSRVGSWV